MRAGLNSEFLSRGGLETLGFAKLGKNDTRGEEPTQCHSIPMLVEVSTDFRDAPDR